MGEIVSQVPEQRVVVFVDELDRCRPTYAIKLLERIKHLFDVEGLIFVLSVDKTQLGHAIQGVYGSGCDAEGYLRRFIDLEYSLRMGDCADFIKSRYGEIETTINKLPNNMHQPFEDPDQCRALFEKLSTLYDLSLREIEQILSRVKLSLLATPSTEYPCLALLQFLMVVREKRRDLYNEYIRSQFSSSVLIRHIDELTPRLPSSKTREFALIEGTLLGIDAQHTNEEFSKLGQYRQSAAINPGSYAHQVTKVADQVMNESFTIATLINRIEFAEQFTFHVSTPANP